jgi:hypothetical protein
MVWAGVFANPALYLRAAPCTPGLAQLACNTSTSAPPTTSSITAPSLVPGAYFLFADGRTTGHRGPFELTVDLYELPDAGTCATPHPLTFSGGVARAEGNTRFLNDGFTATCAPSGGGGEHVYRFDNPSPQDLTLTVSAPGGAPILSLVQGVCAGAGVSCSIGPPNRQVTVPGLAAGTYTLVVEAQAPFNASEFALMATLGAVDAGSLLSGDTCFNPEPLNLSNGTSGTASVTATTTGYFKETGTNACSSGGADRIFTFETTSQRTITATITSTTSGFRPTLIHRRDLCPNERANDSCRETAADGGLPVLTVTAPAGRHYLVVDGAWAEAGDFTLQVSVQ